MNHIDIKSYLAKTDLFSDLKPSALTKLAGIAHHKKIPKHTLLIQENEEAKEMFLIIEGCFSVHKHSRSKEEKVKAEFSVLTPGNFVGELSFLDGHPRSATVEALDENCAVIVIPYVELRGIVSVEFYHKLSKKLGHYLRNTNETVLKSLVRELIQTKIMANMGRFIFYTLLLMSFYNLGLKFLISLVRNPYSNMYAGTVMIAIFTLALGMLVRQMGYPLANYGINAYEWQKALKESLFFTALFIIFITILKWAVIHFLPFYHQPVIDLQTPVTAAKIGTKEYYFWLFSGMLVYGVFAVFQEFISRGVLQSSLQKFLLVKHKNFIANLVTSGVFASMHVHWASILALIIFVPSLFWGWLYNRHNTLISPVVSHVLIGWWAIFVLGIEGFFR